MGWRPHSESASAVDADIDAIQAAENESVEFEVTNNNNN
jgi:hypothetical protein